MNAFLKFKKCLKDERKENSLKLEKMNREIDVFKQSLVRNIFNTNSHNLDNFTNKELQKIEDKILEMEFNKYTLNGMIEELSKIIACIGNESVINFIDLNDLIYALQIYIGESISYKDACQIFGSAVAFYEKHKNKKTNGEILNLAQFYNLNGTFKNAGDADSYYNSLISVFENGKMNYFELERAIKPFMNIQIDSIIENFKIFYKDFYEKSKELNLLSKAKQKSDQSKSNDLKRYHDYISKFYKEKKIVDIPDDMDLFIDALNNIYDSYVVAEIIKLVNLKKEEVLLSSIFNDEEISCINQAKEMIQNNQNENIRHCLEDLNELIILYKEASELEKQELNTLKDEIIFSIKEKIKNIKVEEVQESSNKLIFLTNEENIPYIEKDLEDLDNGLRKKALILINRVSEHNYKFFRPLSKNLYYMYNKNTCVVFFRIDDYFLIIGLGEEKDLKNITNRIKKRQVFIELLINDLSVLNKTQNILKTEEEYKINLDEKYKLVRRKH